MHTEFWRGKLLKSGYLEDREGNGKATRNDFRETGCVRERWMAE
jgi:hypothetical protein